MSKRHPSAEPLVRAKNKCRARSCQLEKTGKLKRQPCLWCGAERAERHHTDYSDPSAVVWLCKECHWLCHFEERRGMFLQMLAQAKEAAERCSGSP